MFSYGISGLPEVADHVWTTTLQFFAGLITEDQYRKRLEPAWPGVQASLEQFSVLDDIYHTFVQRAREMAWNVTQSDGWKEQFPKAA